MTILRARFGFDPRAAYDAFELLAADEATLAMFQTWLRTGELDRSFQGSVPTWLCSDCMPYPTPGQLLDEGGDPIDAFLYLAYLARQVDEEIQVLVGRAGY